MPRWAWNKSPAQSKRRFFELIRQGASGLEASLAVGVSPSCGSLWFIDAGRVNFIERPISSRYLSQDDRIEIADGLAGGEPVKSIAARIGKSYQTVYREVARNSKPDGRYQPWFAHNQAHLRRRRPRPRRLVVDERLRAVIADKLARHWSPRQISRWLRRRWPRRRSWHLSVETIYESVYPTNMKPIHTRPPVVDTRKQIGHWEGDLLLGCGRHTAIATLVERKARHTILVPIRDGWTAERVGDALIAVFNTLPPALRRTLTWDQGNELFHHQRIEQATGTKIYFADAHSPWQRGTNENTNGLLRQYFPKGVDFTAVSDQQLRKVADELNDRPRECLQDRTPRQLMARWRSHLIAS